MHKTQVILAWLLIAMPIFREPLLSQNSVDSLLSSLRGRWEYHTYYDRWTLQFMSDRQVFVNNKPAAYSLLGGILRLNDNGKETDYQFKLQNNLLSLTDPDGHAIAYKHRDDGEFEQSVDGKFYAQIDSLSRASIRFQDGKTFMLGSMKSIDNDLSRTVSTHGIYRVEGDLLCLVFSDGTVDTAEIRYRDPDESANGIIFHERLYDKEEILAESPAEPIHITPYYPPPIPDPPMPPWPPQPYPLPPVYGPVAPTGTPTKPAVNNDRNFGSTREGITSTHTSDSKREGSRQR